MPYAAMDIARYVINYCISKDKPISNLKLQKILYYIQAAFLVEKGEPCFDEEIVNWRHGPVVEEVYHNFKGYVGSEITDEQTEYTSLEFGGDSIMRIVVKKFKSKEIIREEDRALIKKVIDSLIDFDAWFLVDRTLEEAPWKNTPGNEVIATELIKEFFSSNLANEERIYGKY